MKGDVSSSRFDPVPPDDTGPGAISSMSTENSDDGADRGSSLAFARLAAAALRRAAAARALRICSFVRVLGPPVVAGPADGGGVTAGGGGATMTAGGVGGGGAGGGGFGLDAGGAGFFGAGSGTGTVAGGGGGEGSAGGGVVGDPCPNAAGLAKPSTPTATIEAAANAAFSPPFRRLIGDAGARPASALLAAPTDSPYFIQLTARD